jgi:hypothetical protein
VSGKLFPFRASRAVGSAEKLRVSGWPFPLRYQSVAERWARYQASAGVTVRLGDLRRFHAAELLAGGVPEWVVRQRLGQLSGPLPVPAGTDADDAIRAWRNRRQ